METGQLCAATWRGASRTWGTWDLGLSSSLRERPMALADQLLSPPHPSPRCPPRPSGTPARCSPMRITKKFSGDSRIGKRVYRNLRGSALARKRQARERAEQHLAKLEARFRAKLQADEVRRQTRRRTQDGAASAASPAPDVAHRGKRGAVAVLAASAGPPARGQAVTVARGVSRRRSKRDESDEDDDGDVSDEGTCAPGVSSQRRFFRAPAISDDDHLFGVIPWGLPVGAYRSPAAPADDLSGFFRPLAAHDTEGSSSDEGPCASEQPHLHGPVQTAQYARFLEASLAFYSR